MLNIAHYQRKANQYYNEVSPHTNQKGHHQKNLQTNSVEDVEKREPSYSVGGNINGYSNYGEEYGDFMLMYGKTNTIL